MGIKHLREDENGSGLVLTLMVLLVLSVLGVSIGTLALGSYRLSDANRDDTSAYYVAEAGAVAAYEEIQGEVLSAYENNATEGSFYNHVSSIVTAQNGQSSVDFAEQFGTEPTATIATAQKDSKIYTITSIGEVDGKKRTVTKQFTVTWVEKNTAGGGLPILPDNAALLTQGKIEVSNGTLQGDLYINSVEPKSFQISGNPTFTSATLFYSNKITAEELLDYPSWYNKLPKLEAKDEDWDFGNYPGLLNQISAPNITEKLPVKNIGTHMVQDEDGNVKVTNYQTKNYVLELESDVYIPEMTSNANRSFSIDTGGANRTIVVDALDLGGDIQVEGEGTLTLIVKNSFHINNGGISFNEDGVPNKVTIIYLGNSELDLGKIKLMNGNMIVKNADVKTNNTSINGVFLTGGNTVELSGGGAGSNMVLIAPNAAVSLTGSYSITGSVIAKTFAMGGGTRLSYQVIDTTGFLFGSAAPAADPEPEDIISSEPIIEN
nr:PilX N-terminal domain-containing pilus assembly protein [uncultured Trichococcus sp.]